MYNKDDIDKQAEQEGQALRESDQRQNVNHNRNNVKAVYSEGQKKFDKLFRS